MAYRMKVLMKTHPPLFFPIDIIYLKSVPEDEEKNVVNNIQN